MFISNRRILICNLYYLSAYQQKIVLIFCVKLLKVFLTKMFLLMYMKFVFLIILQLTKQKILFRMNFNMFRIYVIKNLIVKAF